MSPEKLKLQELEKKISKAQEQLEIMRLYYDKHGETFNPVVTDIKTILVTLI